jgi:phosphate transport system protein
MPTTPDGFNPRLDRLKAELVAQGERVQRLLETAFGSTFARDTAVAEKIQAMDDEVDRVDVELEKASVALLSDATDEGARLDAAQLRAVLTIVKINNELERIADGGVNIAEQAGELARFGAAVRGAATGGSDIPETFQVMANSVVGILRDVNRAYQRSDAALAKVVLQSEDAVEAFKAAILQDAERQIAAGAMPVDFAFALHEIANECCRMADHCTNIAEQVIYSLSGAIVRHTDAGWVEVRQ